MGSSPSLRWIRRASQGIQPGTPQPALGVLGGTFNPVTLGHLALAEQASAAFHFHEALFVLPEKLPHRAAVEASMQDRVAMLEAALKPFPHFSLAVSTHGLFLDIARALEPHYPLGVQIFFLVGVDAAERILQWPYRDRAASLREMFSRFGLVIAQRAGKGRWPDEPELAAYAARLHPLEMPAACQEVSASAVRAACRAGKPLEGLVPAAVADYIRKKKLYRSQ